MWPLLVVLLSQTPEPPAARAEARRLFVQGEKEFASGAVAAAESSFRQSFSLLPLPATAFNLARCAQQTNATAAAIGWYRRYLRLAPAADDRAQVEAALAAQNKRLAARGVQALTLFLSPAGATARVDDGAPVRDGATLELAPGSHQVVVSGDGLVTSQLEVNLSLAASSEIAVTLVPPSLPAGVAGFAELPSRVSPTPADVPAREEVKPVQLRELPTFDATAPPVVVSKQPEAKPHRFKFAWVGLGVTGAAALTGLISGLVAFANSTQLTDGTLRDRMTATSLRDSALTSATVANGSWIAAGVLAVATSITFGVEW